MIFGNNRPETILSVCLAYKKKDNKKQALKIVRFQRHLRLAISLYVLQDHWGSSSPLDFFGLSSALKDNTIEPKKRKETRSKPTKMAREKVNATDNTYYN